MALEDDEGSDERNGRCVASLLVNAAGIALARETGGSDDGGAGVSLWERNILSDVLGTGGEEGRTSVFKLLRAGTALAVDGGTDGEAVGILEIKRQSGELD